MELDDNLFPALMAAAPAPLSVPAQYEEHSEYPEVKTETLTDHDARLICDLVAGVRTPAVILAQYGLTQEDLSNKSRNPAWAAAYIETKKVWESSMNTQTRIRMKAAFLLEDSLVPLFKIIQNSNTPLKTKLEAIDQLTKISTVANVIKDAPGTGERHSITINIGAGVAPVTVSSQSERVIPHEQ